MSISADQISRVSLFVTVVCRHPPAPIFGHCGEGGRPVRPRLDAPVRTGDENRHLHADQWTMVGRKKKYHILLTINSKLSSKIQDLIHPRRASHNISLVTATTLAIITATFCNGWLHVAPKKKTKKTLLSNTRLIINTKLNLEMFHTHSRKACYCQLTLRKYR